MQFKNPSLIIQFYILGFFVNFWVIFWYIWKEIVFLKGLVELGERFNVVIKLEFEIKILGMDTQIVPYQPGVLWRGGQLSGGVSKIIFLLLSLLKPPNIALNFR